jgi:hypothetical protein
VNFTISTDRRPNADKDRYDARVLRAALERIAPYAAAALAAELSTDQLAKVLADIARHAAEATRAAVYRGAVAATNTDEEGQ